jgi:hypothetical protein
MVSIGSLVKLKYKIMCTILDESGLREIWVDPDCPGVVIKKYTESCIVTCDIVINNTMFYSVKIEDLMEI